MTKPIRVKREYYKKLPSNTKVVSRPSRFGNPLKIGVKDGKKAIFVRNPFEKKTYWLFLMYGDLLECLRIYKALLYNDRNYIESIDKDTANPAYSMLFVYVNRLQQIDYSELKGKNLACFCKLEDDCHADILLEFVEQYKIQ